MIRKGTILGVRDGVRPEIAVLDMCDSSTGEVVGVYCDAEATRHYLSVVFGDQHQGQEIYWTLDPLGLMLSGIIPVDTAPESIVKLYEEELCSHEQR